MSTSTPDLSMPTLASYTSGTIGTSGNIVLTFSEAMAAGSGNIVITDGATQTYMSGGLLRTRIVGATDTRTISITGPEVSINGNVVTIDLGSDLGAGRKYSVQMATGVLEDLAGNDFKGLTDSTRLSFTTSAAAAPSAAIDSAIGMTDTGALATDYITSATSQVFSGTFTGTLAGGEVVQVSLNGGATWQQAAVSGNSWSYANTISASGSVMARVINSAGVSSTAQSHDFVLDITPPVTPTIVLSNGSLTAGQTSIVTVTFAEKVSGLDAADFTVSGGTLGAFTTSDQGITWTATLTPTSGVANGSGSVTLSAGSITDIAGNTGPAAASSATAFSYDTAAAPSAVVDGVIAITESGSSDTDYITNATSQSFSGSYTGTLASGEFVGVSLDGGTTWNTATAADNAWSYAATISASGGVMARVSNDANLHSTAQSQVYTLDTAAPTAPTIALTDDSLTAGQTTTVTVTFAEKVTGLASADFTVSGGTLGTFSTADEGITWIATLTPTAGVVNGSGSVTLSASAVTDVAGNTGPAAASSATAFSYNTATAPTAAVGGAIAITESGSSNSDYITNATSQSFSGSYTGTLASGEFVEVSLDGGATWNTATAASNIWSYAATISASGSVMARVANAANLHSTAQSQAYTLDTTTPATPTIALGDSSLTAGQTTAVTVTFAEKVTGLANTDFTVTGGTLGEFSTADLGFTWTATLTPTAGVVNGSGSVTLSASAVTDSAGNTGPAAASSATTFSYDTATAPTAAVGSAIAITESGSSNSDYITNATSQSFSGSYTGTLAGGEFVEVSLDGGTTWNPATAASNAWSYAATISASGGVMARVANAANLHSTAQSQAYTLDTTAPATPTIALGAENLTIDETTTVTVTFAEKVTGLANTDFTVSGGTLGAFSTSDSGITWTATLTPTAGVANGLGSVALSASTVADIAGNTGPAAASSATTFNYHTAAAPTAAVGSVIAITESGSSNSDYITNATSQSFSGSYNATLNGSEFVEVSLDGGTSWNHATATSNTWSYATTISASGSVMARVGNAAGLYSTAQSQAYTLDTTVPATPTIVLTDDSLTAGQTTAVTVTFTEKVTGLANTDFSVSGGTLGEFNTADLGFTWTATLTPTAGVASGSGSVTLSASSVTDIAGNTGPANTSGGAEFSYNTATTPAAAVGSAIAITESGSSDTDYITNATSQSFSGSYTGTLTSGEFVEVSLDGGTTWNTATATSNIWSYAATISASGSVMARVGNAAGLYSTAQSQAYTLDTSAPGSMSSKTPALLTASDTGASTTDRVTSDATPTVTFSLPLAGGFAAGDIIDIIDTGKGDEVVGTYTLTSADLSGQGAISVTLDQLSSNAGDGDAHVLKLRAADAAGNTGTVSDSGLSITVDTTAPTLQSTSPTANATGVNLNSTITLTFDEEIYLHGSHTFSIQTASQVVQEISGESGGFTQSGNSIIITPPITLSAGTTYTVTINYGDLADYAGNIGYAQGSTLATFTTASIPSTPTLSFTDTANATGSGTGSDYITSNGLITVSGLTAANAEYTISEDDDWHALTIANGGATFTLEGGASYTGYPKVRQYDDPSNISEYASLEQALTVDTAAPSAYVSSYPSFFGLGGVVINALTGSLSAALGSGEFVEYTTDNGVNWTRVGTIDGSAWSLSGLQLAEGGAFGLRVSDTAGNIGGNGDLDISSGYTVYVGDGYGGTFNAATMPHLHAGYGNDTISTSGNAAGYLDGGGGADTVSITGAVSGAIDGGDGNDVIEVTGAVSGTVDGDDGDDGMTFSGTVSGEITGGTDNDTLVFNGAVSGAVSGGSGTDAITLMEAVSGTIDGGEGADNITVNGALSTAGTITGGDGADTIAFSGLVSGSANGGDGNDTLTFSTTVGGDVDGGNDNDTLTFSGSVAGDVTGGANDDTIVLNGAVSGTVRGGSGADTISLSSLPTGTVDGGSGTDTLVLSGTGLSIATAQLGELLSFENISMGSGNSMTLTPADVMAWSDTDTLKIDGNSTDTLYLEASAWSNHISLDLLGWVSYIHLSSGAVLHVYTHFGAGVDIEWDA
ncbi:Ig-like domain-containing protein [Pseudoduganella namucuonensis]|uniref:Ig-like domain-containing protein n=1 Tax=Pseudoduganella namucuonensis TaxID=1035707 RepID=A0A1I7ETD2_9BURK|nr:Ig-like domain-containing protein [Pseudoduganella namucuonensis]SFU27142.1 Ig-like domain-containing protein [Pseudoduganella namucuonensis]